METSTLAARNLKEAFFDFIKGVLTLNPVEELNKNYSYNYSSVTEDQPPQKQKKIFYILNFNIYKKII